MEESSINYLKLAICRNLHISGIFQIKRGKKEIDDDIISKKMRKIFVESNYTYGFRRMRLAFIKEGTVIGVRRVIRFMKENRMMVIQRKMRKYSHYRGTIGHIALNLVQRRFDVYYPLPFACTRRD